MITRAVKSDFFSAGMRVLWSVIAFIVLFLFLDLNLSPKSYLAFAAGPSITPIPTVDRLAEPTLPANPDQADLGAQDYWLNCMPCHGDVGQGLTDEFRKVYPEEDRNCWSSGCHGSRPYENGFTLPTSVPRIIGPQALTHFNTAAGLHGFIKAAMPYQDPGSLDEEIYWQLTAFLLRENDLLSPGEPLDPENAALVRIKPEATAAIITPAPPATPVNQEASSSPQPTPQIQAENSISSYLVPVVSLGLVLAGFLVLLLRAKTTSGT